MEINSLFNNTAYLENVRFNSSTVSSSQNFADVLDRVSRSQNTEQDEEASEVSGVASLMSAQSSASVVAASVAIDKNSELYQLCIELETFIIKNILGGMRNTVMKSGLVEESFAGKMYEDMLWDEYAKVYAQNAGFGLAEQAYRQLSGI